MAIQGTVTDAREPVVVLQTFPKKRKISVIIDTGFSGELCLPRETIHAMGFERFGREPFVLADGRIVRADVYKGEIRWFNHRRSVEVIALDNPQTLHLSRPRASPGKPWKDRRGRPRNRLNALQARLSRCRSEFPSGKFLELRRKGSRPSDFARPGPRGALGFCSSARHFDQST